MRVCPLVHLYVDVNAPENLVQSRKAVFRHSFTGPALALIEGLGRNDDQRGGGFMGETGHPKSLVFVFSALALAFLLLAMPAKAFCAPDDPQMRFAVLYDADGDGEGETLVFQVTPDEKEGKGSLVETWQFDQNSYAWNQSKGVRPWYDVREQIVSVEFADVISPVSLADWFSGMSALKSVDLSLLDTSRATSMSGLFKDCRSLTHLDLRSFDTSQVTIMSSMFMNCSRLKSVDLSSFDTSRVRSSSYMFCFCSRLPELDIASFSSGAITYAYGMFYSCGAKKIYATADFDLSGLSGENSGDDLLFKGGARLVGGKGTPRTDDA